MNTQEHASNHLTVCLIRCEIFLGIIHVVGGSGCLIREIVSPEKHLNLDSRKLLQGKTNKFGRTLLLFLSCFPVLSVWTVVTIRVFHLLACNDSHVRENMRVAALQVINLTAAALAIVLEVCERVAADNGMAIVLHSVGLLGLHLLNELDVGVVLRRRCVILAPEVARDLSFLDQLADLLWLELVQNIHRVRFVELTLRNDHHIAGGDPPLADERASNDSNYFRSVLQLAFESEVPQCLRNFRLI